MKSLGENFTLFLCSISAEAEVLSLSEIVGAPRTDPYPIFLDDLDCMTNDTSLLGCNGGNRGLPTCFHDDDAAVHCEGIIVTHVIQSLRISSPQPFVRTTSATLPVDCTTGGR